MRKAGWAFQQNTAATSASPPDRNTLCFRLDGTGLHLLRRNWPASDSFKKVVAAAVGPGVDLVGELMEERRRDAENDRVRWYSTLRAANGPPQRAGDQSRVAPHLGRSIMSAVNVAEVAKRSPGRRGMSASSVLADVCKIVGEIRPFDMEQARLSAALDEKTKSCRDWSIKGTGLTGSWRVSRASRFNRGRGLGQSGPECLY